MAPTLTASETVSVSQPIPVDASGSQQTLKPSEQWTPNRVVLVWLLVGVCAAHFMIDHYSSMITPLLPALAHKLALNKESAGGLIALSSIGSSMLQPVWGWGSERLGQSYPSVIPFLIPLAVLMTGAFLPWMVVMPDYMALALLVTFAYLGVGLFHPVGTALVHRLSPPEKKNWYMSLFMSAGVMGFSTGPKVVATVIGQWGFDYVKWLSISSILLLAPLLWHSWKTQSYLRDAQEGASRVSSSKQSFVEADPQKNKPSWQTLRFKLNTPSGRWVLACLCFNNVCRTMLLVGLATFLPFVWTDQKFTAMQIADILFYATLIGGPLGIVGGRLADKWLGEQWLLRLSFAPCLLLIPVMFLLPQGLAHPASYWVMAGCLSASMGANMVMALRHIEGPPNIISGIVAGWAFGIAGLCMKPVGALIDLHGHAVLFPFYLCMAVLGLLSVDVLPWLLKRFASRCPEHQALSV